MRNPRNSKRSKEREKESVMTEGKITHKGISTFVRDPLS